MTSKNGKGLEQAETIVAEKTTTSAEASSPTSVPVAGGAEATMVLAGRYELLALVGAGGMGSVYRARDRELDEIVALKMLNAELIGSEAMLERFRREVKLARRIAHPNVARVHDIGEHAGQRFLTMEFIAGQSLGTKLGREPRLSLGRAVSLALGICAGVSAAHAAGVVHRDLKPDNVMLKDDGQPVVTDFGIARSVQQHDVKQTALGAVVGTPAYMAPEQVEGSSVDERTDVYALGVLLFELLTGRLPFEGDSPYVVAAKRLSEPAPDPRQARADIPDAV
ncbi:MAG TPA: serine/threonine-protein kinase, partial [Polyangiaceae bacterium]|nr:serine/threonine-protein kinase [Polyangiaceae bacterium]